MEKEIYQPKTLQEAIKHYSDINTCLEFLIPIRWPNGITCPNCNGIEHSFLSTRQHLEMPRVQKAILRQARHSDGGFAARSGQVACRDLDDCQCEKRH
jgi:hypothetical protein